MKNIVSVEAITKGKNSSLIIESSFDNVEWTKVVEGNSFRQLKPVVGKFFRITALEDTKVEEFKVYAEGRIAAKIDTNIRISTNQEIKPEYMIDDDYGTTFVCSDQIESGKYVTLDFGKEINIRDIKLVQGPGEDMINSGHFLYSSDGENWSEIKASFENTETIVKDLDVNARYLKMESTGRRDRWLRIREFSVNNTIEEYVTVSSAKGTYVDRAENVRDNNLNTAYIPERDIVTGDYLLYRIFDGKLSNRVTIAQGENNISNAKVVAQTINGEVLELGKLDKGYNEFNLENPRQLVSVKLIWETDSARPEIYEVKPTFVSVDSQRESIENKVLEAEKLLEENKDIDNNERKELEVAINTLRGLLEDENATDEQIIKAYEDLLAKMTAFKETIKDVEEPSNPENPSSPEEPSNPNDEDGATTKPQEPSTSKPNKTGDMAGTLGLLGAALVSLGGVFAFKKENNKIYQ